MDGGEKLGAKTGVLGGSSKEDSWLILPGFQGLGIFAFYET